MSNAQAGVVAAQLVVSLHLPSLSGERCSACGDAFPCGFRRVAERTLDAFGLLPRRVPGAALRAAGVHPVNPATPPESRHRREIDWKGRSQWFTAAVNPAIGRARVPGQPTSSASGDG